jgi:N-acetylglucosamine kinase-like BadF-type ATPase
MSRPPLVLGVDAGNTKTDAVLAGVDGTILAWARSGTGDIYNAAGSDAAIAEVRAAVDAVLGDERPDHIAFRLAGIDWPEDTRLWDAVIEGWGVGATRSLKNDGFAGIRLGFPSGVGLAITGGTGAAFAARAADGRESSLDMWGQDDFGAKGLGIAGYRAVVLAELGLARPTALAEAYLEFFAVPSVDRLVHLFTAREHLPVKASLARTAPLVTAAASHDPVAQRIVDEQAALLTDYALATARRAGDESLPIVLAGTVLSAPDSPLARRVRERIGAARPGTQVSIASLPAVCGAVLDAIAEYGAPLTSGTIERVAETLPAGPRPARAVSRR